MQSKSLITNIISVIPGNDIIACLNFCLVKFELFHSKLHLKFHSSKICQRNKAIILSRQLLMWIDIPRQHQTSENNPSPDHLLCGGFALGCSLLGVCGALLGWDVSTR